MTKKYSLEKLNDNLSIYQLNDGYKFTSDAVLLAKFAKAKRGEVVADFCAGSGIVGFYFWALNKGIKSVTFLELQKELSHMCLQSIKLNNLDDNFQSFNMRVQDAPKKFSGAFSLILCNPPYEKTTAGFSKQDEKIALCRSEVALTLDELMHSVSKCLKFGGRLCLVHRADRLAEVFCTMQKYKIEPKILQFVENKPGQKPYLVLIQGVLGAKNSLTVLNNIANTNFGK